MWAYIVIALLIIASFAIFPVRPASAAVITSTSITMSEPLVPFSGTAVSASKPPSVGVGQDKGLNTIRYTQAGIQFFRPGGNITIGNPKLNVSNTVTPLAVATSKNTSMIDYKYSGGGLSADFLIKNDTESSYNRRIIIQGTAPPSATLQIQLSNPNNLAPSVCDETPQPGINGNLFQCTSVLFGSMGFDWSDIPNAKLNNATYVLYVPVSGSFLFDPLALDGSGKAGTCAQTNTLSASITTTISPDVIIAFVATTSGSNPYPITVSGGGLTWTLRKSYNPANTGAETVDEYYAIASGTLSAASITAALNLNSFESLTVFGVSGANTGSPFDSNAGLPAVNSNTLPAPAQFSRGVLVSTSNANDFIFGLHTIGNCQTYTAGAGFTAIQNPPTSGSEYQVVAATQTNLNVTATTSIKSYWAVVGDAVQSGVTQTIKITNIYRTGAPDPTITVSGCSPGPNTTFVANNNPKKYSFSASCTVTLTEPAAGTNTRHEFNVSPHDTASLTVTFATCASGTCTQYNNNSYYQLLNNHTATPQTPATWDAAYTWTISGTYLGTAGDTQGCTITTSGGGVVRCSNGKGNWWDYNKAVNFPALIGNTWAAQAPSSFTDTTGGNSHNANYVQSTSAAVTTIDFNMIGYSAVVVFLFFFPFLFIKRRRKR